MCSPYVSPYNSIINKLINEVRSAPDKANDLNFRAEYLKEIANINAEENEKAVVHYIRCALKALYGDNHKQQDSDVARLVLGAQPKDINFTAQEQHAIVSMFVEICKNLYGDTASTIF